MKGIIDSWWLFVLRGVAACIFGVLLLARPGASLAALVLLYGAYALVEGGFTLYSGIVAGQPDERGGMLVLAGAVGIAAGVLTFLWPAISAIALFFVIASWAIVLGVLQIVAGLRLRSILQSAWLLALAGFLAVALGVIMLANPLIGVSLLVGVFATYAFLLGGVNVVLGLRLHRLGQPAHL